MPELPPFRFGVVSSAPTPAEWIETARRAEGQGYSTLLNSDHLDGTHLSQFSPMIALTAAAAATETLRLGTSVVNQAFRHPAVFAREAASLDAFSGGRFEIGIGGGSAEGEHHKAGIPWGDGKERSVRMWEFHDVVVGLLAPGPFSYSGRYFDIDEMEGEPTLARRPKVMIGAAGPRNLARAAREAEIVSTLAPTAAAMDERKAAIDIGAAASGRDPERQQMVMAVAVTDGSPIDAVLTREDAGKALGAIAATTGKAEEEDLFASPLVLAGSVAAVVEELLARRERWGLSYFAVHSPEMDEFAPVVAELTGR